MTVLDWSLTHAGAVRPHNEDAVVCRADVGVWAVADGAGGHQAGEVASAMIAATLGAIPAALSAEEALSQVRLRLAAVHDALRGKAARELRDGALIASTVVVLLIRDGHFACVWAGDSRAYLLRGGALCAITRDHSLTQELVDAGQDAQRLDERQQAWLIHDGFIVTGAAALAATGRFKGARAPAPPGPSRPAPSGRSDQRERGGHQYFRLGNSAAAISFG